MTAKITLLALLVAATLLTGCRTREIRPLTEEEKTQVRAQALQEIAAAKQRLKLTPDQEAKLRPIVMEGFSRRKAILLEYEGQTLSMADLREIESRMKPIGEESKAKLAEFFSAEQMAELEKVVDEFRERMLAMLKERQ
jgi:outer membrane murein-binding lipoprotein Lpp